MTATSGGLRTGAWFPPQPPARTAPVVVIGAGQAGLSAAYHLQRRGVGYVVLDAEDGPGGAWRHRWRSLRMATVNGIFDLPGMSQPPAEPSEPAADAVPRYFAAYEREFGFPVYRPVRVLAVRDAADRGTAGVSDDPGGLLVETSQGTWAARAVINATGTWTAPHWPVYPGQRTFTGRQLHAAQYVSAAEFTGQHVVVVGGGISAVQLLDEISQVTSTTWFTRSEPAWSAGEFTADTARAAVARVEADARAGRPIGSIVSYTGLSWTSYARAAAERSALVRQPMFTAIEPDGVRLAGGSLQRADVILWATGFGQAVGHLTPLRLRGDLGGIALDGTAAAADRRIHLIGYGPSQSTVGANRAGRAAATAVSQLLRGDAGHPRHFLLLSPVPSPRAGIKLAPGVVAPGVITARHRNIALLVAGCFFMEMLDGTIVTTASPQIGRSLHAPAAEVGLVVTAYLLTLAVLIPLSGWLTRRYGNRVIFLTAIAVFTLASVGCAASVTLGMLVALRVLQGVGGAMMVPVGRTMVLSSAAKEDILRLTSYVVWPGLLAPVIAPLAGGLITTYATWHWMFLINVPLGVVAFAAAWRLVTARPAADRAAPPPLDWAGVILTCAGLGALTYAAHLVALPAPPAAQTAAFAVASAALLGGAVAHLRRAAHPLLNLRTLSVPTFRVSQLGGTMYYFVVGAMPFLLPLMFQVQFGWSPVKSGAVTAFVFAGNVGIKPATTPLIHRFGFRPLLVAATLGTALIVAALGFTTASTPVALIAALALASGVTRSTGLTVYTTVGLADMAPELMRDASTLAATSMQLGTGLAIAGATVALRAGDAVTGGGQRAYTVAFCALALVAVGCAAEALRLVPAAGDAARRPRSPAVPPAPAA